MDAFGGMGISRRAGGVGHVDPMKLRHLLFPLVYAVPVIGFSAMILFRRAVERWFLYLDCSPDVALALSIAVLLIGAMMVGILVINAAFETNDRKPTR
ncbi:MAG: hypothetical protein EPO08_03530 [Rhodospirillaceae bacterium]|nr:MAG: hypothetical protein EPO08_03530 [Rhodospirillaceae bacterium]